MQVTERELTVSQGFFISYGMIFSDKGKGRLEISQRHLQAQHLAVSGTLHIKNLEV